LTPDLTLFEFGSGYSTSFFASRVKHVTSIEKDAEWHALVKKMVPANADLILFDSNEDGAYCRAASRQGRKFDVIVIDADDRNECLKEAPASLSDSGVILLDDAQREAHRQSIADLIAKEGFRKLDFEGLKPGAIGAYRTTLFYRSNNCLGL
jgi:predicted O-methyltransferase YrrM